MNLTDDQKKALEKLLRSMVVSRSSFEAADLALRIAEITEESNKDSKPAESSE